MTHDQHLLPHLPSVLALAPGGTVVSPSVLLALAATCVLVALLSLKRALEPIIALLQVVADMALALLALGVAAGLLVAALVAIH